MNLYQELQGALRRNNFDLAPQNVVLAQVAMAEARWPYTGSIGIPSDDGRIEIISDWLFLFLLGARDSSLDTPVDDESNQTDAVIARRAINAERRERLEAFLRERLKDYNVHQSHPLAVPIASPKRS